MAKGTNAESRGGPDSSYIPGTPRMYRVESELDSPPPAMAGLLFTGSSMAGLVEREGRRPRPILRRRACQDRNRERLRESV